VETGRILDDDPDPVPARNFLTRFPITDFPQPSLQDVFFDSKNILPRHVVGNPSLATRRMLKKWKANENENSYQKLHRTTHSSVRQG